jgi:hypothetical protein
VSPAGRGRTGVVVTNRAGEVIFAWLQTEPIDLTPAEGDPPPSPEAVAWWTEQRVQVRRLPSVHGKIPEV